MKIALIAYEYPPCSFGGIGFFSKELAEGISLSGTDLTVIACSNLGAITVKNVNRHLRIIRVPMVNMPPRHLWWQLRNRGLIVKLLNRISPNVVHANSLVASLALQKIKKTLPIPTVVTIHGDHKKILEIALKYSGFMQPYDFLTYIGSEPLHERLLQMDVEAADYAVTVAKHVQKDISAKFKSASFASIYNGISTNTILAQSGAISVPNRIGGTNKEQKFKIAYAGRLFWIKGITLVLKAFTILTKVLGFDNVELNVYGDGPLRTEVLKYSKMFRGSRSRIVYHGMLPRIHFFRELQCNDIFVVPSLYEACPMTLFEGLSLGKPVIVSKMPWSEEFIEHGVNGLKTNTLDPNAFATTLSELVTNEGLMEKISREATKSVKKYEISKTVAMYQDLYRKLAK